jgi:hypothetical protein
MLLRDQMEESQIFASKLINMVRFNGQLDGNYSRWLQR